MRSSGRSEGASSALMLSLTFLYLCPQAKAFAVLSREDSAFMKLAVQMEDFQSVQILLCMQTVRSVSWALHHSSASSQGSS